MIIDYLFDWIFQGISALLSYFTSQPDVTQLGSITSGIVTFISYYSAFSDFFPISTLLLIVAFDVSFESKWFTYKLIRWGYQKIPGIK